MSDHYRRSLVRWRLARDIASWSVPAFIVGAAIVWLAFITVREFGG